MVTERNDMTKAEARTKLKAEQEALIRDMQYMGREDRKWTKDYTAALQTGIDAIISVERTQELLRMQRERIRTWTGKLPDYQMGRLDGLAEAAGETLQA